MLLFELIDTFLKFGRVAASDDKVGWRLGGKGLSGGEADAAAVDAGDDDSFALDGVRGRLRRRLKLQCWHCSLGVLLPSC